MTVRLRTRVHDRSWIGARLDVLEAFGALAAARLLLGTVPFAWLRPILGVSTRATIDDIRPPRDSVVTAVAKGISRAAARLPWHSTCLVRALAGRLMLMRRGVPSTLVLGVTKDQGDLLAHAWLVARDGVVCGGREASAYSPLASFDLQ